MRHATVLAIVVRTERELILIGMRTRHLALLSATETIDAAQGLSNLHAQGTVRGIVLILSDLLVVVNLIRFVVVHSLSGGAETHAEGSAG